MNYWSGTETAEGWMGEFKGPDGKAADYEWVKTSTKQENPPMGDPFAQPTPPPTPPASFDGDWSKVDPLELGFAATDKYAVTPAADNKSAQITYSGITTDYSNVEMDITAAADGNNYAHLKIKNNGTASVNIRVNLINDEQLSAGAQNAAVNRSATQDGVRRSAS